MLKKHLIIGTSGLLLALVLTSSVAQKSFASDQDFHRFTLLSWQVRANEWCFSLRESDEVDEKIRKESASRVCGVDALKRRLRELPHGSYVNWNKYRAIGFDYPPPDQIEEVQRFAKQLGLYLYFNFFMEEQCLREYRDLADTGDYNLFCYCHNDPVDNVDPMGLEENLAQKPISAWDPTGGAWAKEVAQLQAILNQKLLLGYGAISVGGLQYAVTQLQQTMGDTANFHMAQMRIAGNAAQPQLQSAKVQGPIGGVADLIGKIWTLPNTVLGLVAEIAMAPFALTNGGYFDLANNSIQLVFPFGRPGDAVTLGNTQIYFGKTDPGAFGAYGNPSVNYGYHEQGHTYQYQTLGVFFLPAYFLSGHPFTLNNPFEAGAQNYAIQYGPSPPSHPDI